MIDAYTLRNVPRVLPNGDLEQELEEARSLKPENQPYFDNYVRFGARDGLLLAKGRKEILEKFRYSNLWLPGDHCLIFSCMFIGKSEEAP